MNIITAPAFQELAADVDGAVVPYLLIVFAVVLPIFSVGSEAVLELVNLTNTCAPVTKSSAVNVPLTIVVVFAFVPAAVAQVQYGIFGEVRKPLSLVKSLVFEGRTEAIYALIFPQKYVSPVESKYFVDIKRSLYAATIVSISAFVIDVMSRLVWITSKSLAEYVVPSAVANIMSPASQTCPA